MSMASVIIPKSDQLNADSLISGPITIRIRKITIEETGDQRVSVFYDGDDNKPFKPCKSMCKAMVIAWGEKSAVYIGRSMTLYRDPKVKWAGMEVGGIRISHMSNIDHDLKMALTETKGKKAIHTVRVLKTQDEVQPTQKTEPALDKILSGVEYLEKQINVSQSVIALDSLIESKDVKTRRDWLRQHQPELSKRIEDAIALRAKANETRRVQSFGPPPELDEEDVHRKSIGATEKEYADIKKMAEDDDFPGDELVDKERVA